MINVLGSIFLKYRFTILSFLYFGILAFWMRVGLPDSRFFFNLIYAVLNAVILQSLIILISKIPKLRGQFAEFLNNASPDGLRILFLTTCVGLQYGHPNNIH